MISSDEESHYSLSSQLANETLGILVKSTIIEVERPKYP